MVGMNWIQVVALIRDAVEDLSYDDRFEVLLLEICQLHDLFVAIVLTLWCYNEFVFVLESMDHGYADSVEFFYRLCDA